MASAVMGFAMILAKLQGNHPNQVLPVTKLA
jgi:hypothetical protein